MSSEAGNSSAAWRANGSYPAKADREANTPDSVIPIQPENSGRPTDIPTPKERIRDIVREYPEKVLRPISEQHGAKLRRDTLEDAERVRREYETGEFETEVTFETVRQDGKSWLDVIWTFLRDYEEYRDRYLRMARGDDRRGDYESFLIDLYNSYDPKYQKEQYAKLKALKRMAVGEDREKSPTGEKFDGEYEEPVAVIFGLTASATPTGRYGDSEVRYRPVVDHDREIREAWSGSSNSVKRTLRYVLEEKAGLSSESYMWWWQSEPHAGEGEAAGYSHSHPVVIFDRAEVDAESPDMTDRETYRSVVAKHVEVCETAKWSAHEITRGEKSSVKVSHGDDIEDVAAYIADYIQVDTEADLLERSEEYIMWAASQWASSTQKYSKNKTATEAITADKCHQQYVDSETEQTADHAERVTRSGEKFECYECGSTWCVSQSPETLTEARVGCETDGGLSVGCETKETVSFDYEDVSVIESSETARDGAEDDVRETPETFAERWPSARSGGRIGQETVARECEHESGSNKCPCCCEEGETVAADIQVPDSARAPDRETVRSGFERAPEWRPEAVVQKWSGEERLIGEPSGVEYGEVTVPGKDAIAPEKCIPPGLLKQPEPWTEVEGLTEEQIRSGEYPPPEVIASQLAEVHHGKRITPKEWPDDWYARRYEESTSVADDDREWSPIVEKVEDRSPESLTVEEKQIVERIELVESAHAEADAVVLAGKYDAVCHIELVERTLEVCR